MNVQEWYKQIWASNVPLQFAAEQLAERDAKIETQRSDLVATTQIKNGMIQELERKLESSQRQVADKAMKVVNQRSYLGSLSRMIDDERKAHLETKQKLEEAEKRGAVAMSRLIENWLSKEYMPKILGFDFAKGDSWAQREQQVGSAQTTSDWGSGSCGESAAENEARETESLAHRIERHDTQFRRITERFDRHAKKLTELDGEIRHARDSRRKMHAQIGALESNIADSRKTAEVDRVEFRAADAALHERIANLSKAMVGECYDMPAKPLLEMWLNTERGLAQIAKRINAVGIPPLGDEGQMPGRG
jgi:chromosome segregation ATPase